MTIATIASRAQADTTYTVTLHDSGAAECTCPAGTHGRSCWHIQEARYVAVEAEWAAQYRAYLTSALETARREYAAWVGYHRECQAKREGIAKWAAIYAGLKSELAVW